MDPWRLLEVAVYLVPIAVGGWYIRDLRRRMRDVKSAVLSDIEAYRLRVTTDLEEAMHQVTKARSSMLADLGRMLMLDGKPGEAIEMLSQYLETNPGDINARWQRGQCYERRDEWILALEDYQIALDRLPRAPEGPHQEGQLLLAVGRVLHNLGRHSEAIEPLKRAWEHPHGGNKCEALRLLGNCSRLSGDLDMALGWYNKCLELFPRDAKAGVGYALTLSDMAAQGLRSREEALTWLDHRLQIHPEGAAEYLHARAEIYLRDGRSSAALADLDSVVAINPRDTRPYQVKGTILLRSAQDAWLHDDQDTAIRLAESAREAFKNGLKVAPALYRPVFHNLITQAELLRNHPDEAVNEGCLSAQLRPNYWQNHAALLMALAWTKAWGPLIEAAERALAQDKIQESKCGILWIQFYYSLGLLAREGFTNRSVERTRSLLDLVPHSFSPAFFEFWPVLSRHLISTTSPPAQTLVQAFEDGQVAALFCKELERQAQRLAHEAGA